MQKNSENSANHLSANPTKWPNTLKRFVGNLPTNCFSVFDTFMGLVFRKLRKSQRSSELLIKIFEQLYHFIVTHKENWKISVRSLCLYLFYVELFHDGGP